MKTTADFRNTRFEIHEIKQGANGLTLGCLQRGVTGSSLPPLEVPFGALTEEQNAALIDAFEMLEKAFETVLNEWAAHPTRMHEQVSAAKRIVEEAKLEKQRIDLAHAKKAEEAAELDAQIAAKKAHLEQLAKQASERTAPQEEKASE